jgi:hypothetical protein
MYYKENTEALLVASNEVGLEINVLSPESKTKKKQYKHNMPLKM